jgi:hypothetical protein
LKEFPKAPGAFCTGLTWCVLRPLEAEQAALAAPAVIVGLAESEDAVVA